MSKYRLTNIAALALFIGILSLISTGLLPIWMLVSSVCAYLLFLIFASLNIKLNFYLNAINSFPAKGNEVAITFDDGPSGEYSEAVLAILRNYAAKATFFFIGKNVDTDKQTVDKVISEGHQVANHGYSHQSLLPLRSESVQVEDMKKGAASLMKHTGKEIRIYRPPFGVTNPRIARAVRNLGFIPVGWSIRSLDTLKIPADIIAERILRKVQPGDIILFHDGRQNTAGILEKVLSKLNEKKYKFITIDEVVSRN